MLLTNPATGVTREIAETRIEEIPSLVARAKIAQKSWAALAPSERVRILTPILQRLKDRRQTLAAAITEDMGKPLARSEREVDQTGLEAAHVLEHAESWLTPEEAPEGYVEFNPLGVAAIISPWNYPLQLPLRAIVPALAAGNAVVFKPSEQTLAVGLLVEELMASLEGLPEHLFQTLIGGKDHGKALVDQPIAIVSFTGSTAAGKDIMRKCADSIKRVLLELGGLDAAIVLRDADVVQAAQKIVQNNCSNSGQVCCAIKRVYVEREVYDQFVAAAKAASETITIGDPTTAVDMGPLVAEFQLKKVQAIVADAVAKGATVQSGGTPRTDIGLPGQGYFYPSTVLTETTEDMRILTEEAFGPVLPVVAVQSGEEAVEKANSTSYGLAGSVWTRDEARGRKLAAGLEVGVAGINVHGSGAPGAPWGGAKESGLGRMKTKEGLREYTNVKLVRVHPA